MEGRRYSDVSTHDEVGLVEDNEVRLTKQGSVVEQTAGALKSSEQPLSARELRKAAEDAIAEATIERAHR